MRKEPRGQLAELCARQREGREQRPQDGTDPVCGKITRRLERLEQDDP